MPKCGSLGLDMMQSTCAIQVTADFRNEVDMVKKFRVALALQPVVTALFANSPFAHGHFSGYLSYRSKVWGDTNPQRCGSLPFHPFYKVSTGLFAPRLTSIVPKLMPYERGLPV